MSEFTVNPQPLPYPDRLVQYDNGVIDAAWKQRGLSVSLEELKQMALDDPVLRDFVQSPDGYTVDPGEYHGTFVVQTSPHGQRIAFDSRHMTDNHAKHDRLIALGSIDISRIAPIVIGEPWASPLGPTEPVTAIIMPWTRNNLGAEARPGRRANTEQGADWIKAAKQTVGSRTT
ncbi:hypothetical protein KDA23_01330 [Candidatus Saccharibacteria bacterium]|nr:hypothetical protein [Candidatus Saccharibacteria bacterium]